MATPYVGNYFEWTGSTSTMVKYYYAGTTRVAMRVGSNNPKWLLSDHFGSQSIVASYNGLIEEGELRYKAWGETRYTSGTTPTKRQYTGQLRTVTLTCTGITQGGMTLVIPEYFSLMGLRTFG